MNVAGESPLPRPRRAHPVIASLVAAAIWLLPPIFLVIALSSRHSDDAVETGLLLAFLPVAVLFAAFIWQVVGRTACMNEVPPRGRFVIRATVIFAVVGLLWGLRIAWGGPWRELLYIPAAHGAVLGATAIPAALLWWWLGVKPLRAGSATAPFGP